MRVPVLSVQMIVPAPIVSQAGSSRTRIDSDAIFRVVYERARVTASGRPSGTATTMMVKAAVAAKRISSPVSPLKPKSNWVVTPSWTYSPRIRPPRISAAAVMAAAAMPTRPMRPASTSSRSSRGVTSRSALSLARMPPSRVSSPTTPTTARPEPSRTRDPA